VKSLQTSAVLATTQYVEWAPFAYLKTFHVEKKRSGQGAKKEAEESKVKKNKKKNKLK
jgi:hypothetical protein